MGERKKILVVEDEETVLELFRLFLEQDDYIVEPACDGREAIEKLSHTDIDLVIMDLMLPYKSGFEIITQLQQENWGNPPIIAITSRFKDAQTESRIRAQPNVIEFFTKPVDHDVFMEAVHKALSDGYLLYGQ